MEATAKSAQRSLTIELNGVPAETSAATLAEFVVEQGYGDMRVATAVNGAFVAERDRASCSLAGGDAIEVVTARQGG